MTQSNAAEPKGYEPAELSRILEALTEETGAELEGPPTEIRHEGGGTWFRIETLSHPFDENGESCEYLDERNERKRYALLGRQQFEGHHLAYAGTKRCAGEYCDVSDICDFEVWIGRQAPPPAVVDQMKARHYARISDAAYSSIFSASLRLERIEARFRTPPSPYEAEAVGKINFLISEAL